MAPPICWSRKNYFIKIYYNINFELFSYLSSIEENITYKIVFIQFLVEIKCNMASLQKRSSQIIPTYICMIVLGHNQSMMDPNFLLVLFPSHLVSSLGYLYQPLSLHSLPCLLSHCSHTISIFFCPCSSFLSPNIYVYYFF